MIYMNLFFIIFMLNLILLSKFYKHLLMILMCFEFLVLNILFMLFYNLNELGLEFYYLVYMVFFVVESVLGLSLLICLMHFSGSDYMKSLFLIMW